MFCFKKKEEKWILHLIEMKSKVDNKKWHEIKQKIRASYFNVRALKGYWEYILMRLGHIQRMRVLDFGIQIEVKRS